MYVIDCLKKGKIHTPDNSSVDTVAEDVLYKRRLTKKSVNGELLTPIKRLPSYLALLSISYDICRETS